MDVTVVIGKMQFTVKALAKDENGLAFYLKYYREVRLRALQTDPSGVYPRSPYLAVSG